ncbi:MAG: dTDP-4-dehydrorhamnose reductase [Candidatus Eisenbacteria bacterium]
MKVLLTGAGGLLAHATLPLLAAAGHEARALGHAELDITHLDAFRAAASAFQPDWIFHFAAHTRVDDCESDPDGALLVNGLGARNAALAAAGCGGALLTVSSDFVFDGATSTPYREYDAAHPINVYGASKWAGEQAIREVGGRFIIVRTAWLFGPGGSNFVDSILKKARAGEALRVVADQRGSPTYTPDLAAGLLRLAERAEYGTCHAVNSGDASWHELAMAAVREAGLGVEIERIESAALARPARRPVYSVLDTSWFRHVTGRALPDWKDALRRHVRPGKEAV